MSDLSLQFLEIKAMLASSHGAYMKKFGQAVSMLDGEQTLTRTRIKAKLDLLSKAFFDAGVIDEVQHGSISSREGTFTMSVGLTRKNHPMCLYLLNTGTDVIMSDSIGFALSLDTLDSRIILVSDTKRVCKRFYNVLNPDFNWKDMAMRVLDAIHETLYDKHDAMMLELNTIVGE